MNAQFNNEIGSEQLSAKEQWAQDHADVLHWIGSKLGKSNFADSLMKGYAKYSSLTVNQVNAVRKIIAEDKARADKLAAARQQATQLQASGNALDLSNVPSGYYAVPEGDTRLKVRINRPGKLSKWHGWIFVSDGAVYGQQRNYGRQAPGSGCYTGDIQAQLRAIAANPQEASAAYGKLTGQCGVCGRHLEDEESVARGIGPICAGKMGWGE